jgi:hypothetical protein
LDLSKAIEMGVREMHPGALQRLQNRLKKLCDAGFKSELCQTLAAAATKQIADEFAGERDPYGVPWQPLAAGTRAASKRTRAKILRLTGRMAASVIGVPDSRGFTIHMAFPAPVHQHGGYVAPHSRIGGQQVRRNEKTGGFAKRGAKRYLIEIAGHSTYADGITIPRRQLVPMRSTGGLGVLWGRAFYREAGRLVKLRLGKAT